ncbi:MAG: CotH kinase family protein [Verrucomicrobiales bacterium]|nr:CotH kinase family protein [Verrucomicrobiales bacterium]
MPSLVPSPARRFARFVLAVAFLGTCAIRLSLAQPAGPPPDRGPGRGPGGGPGGGPPMGVQPDLELVEKFDRNGDKRLDAAERKSAREFLAKEVAEGRGPRRPGPPGGRRPAANRPPPQPGRPLAPADVPSFLGAPLYDPDVLRTFFLEFESKDWEQELADFYHTDVEVPAKLTVDGKTYPEVGVRFRGASSFFTVDAGLKRSLNLSVDFARKDQRVLGAKTLNLLNSHTDPTFVRTPLYYHVARQYLPAHRANHVRVVINGESWGIYVNVEQYNADFVAERFGSPRGARWKVPGSPRGRGSLAYLGDDPEAYKRIYDLKTKDEPKAWSDLAQLCHVLDRTPPKDLEAALAPILDIDGALKFLALENTFINGDGYWIRSSDYNLYQDPKGRFHIIPHDANETFRAPEGPGFAGGEGARGMELDPLTGADAADKPLISRLLAVPALRQRYLGYVRDMATRWLDWAALEPLVTGWQARIADDVKADTRRLYPFESFTQGVTQDIEEQGFRGPRRAVSLKSFAEQRRKYLLEKTQVTAP